MIAPIGAATAESRRTAHNQIREIGYYIVPCLLTDGRPGRRIFSNELVGATDFLIESSGGLWTTVGVPEVCFMNFFSRLL
jgi:hypothetical protein